MSELSNNETIVTKSSPKVTNFAIGPWIKINFERRLFLDILAYSAEFRDDIKSVLVNLDFCKNHTDHSEHASCTCHQCIINHLNDLLYLNDNNELVIDGINARDILPRYIWYKHELLRNFDSSAVLEIPDVNDNIDSESNEDDDDDEEEILLSSNRSEMAANNENEFDNAEEITSELTIKSLSSDKKRKIQVIACDHTADNEEIVNASMAEPIGQFGKAIRDIQFRLSKHNILAHPKTYRGTKKSDEFYDVSDPWLNDEDDLAQRFGAESDFSDLSTHSNDDGEEWNSDMDEIYEQKEHMFVFDNFSEEEEEIIEKDEQGRRIFKQYKWQKPMILPLVYNPRSWAHNNRRSQIPSFVQVFFKTLEYAISNKRLNIVQRQVYDKYEWVTVNEEEQTLSLNDDAKAAVTSLVKNIVKVTFMYFLTPFLPPDPDVKLPIFLKYVRYGDLEDNPMHDFFVPANKDYAELIHQLITKAVTPYGPSLEECTTWYWAAVADYTIKLAYYIESLCLQYVKSNYLDGLKIDTEIAEFDAANGNDNMADNDNTLTPINQHGGHISSNDDEPYSDECRNINVNNSIASKTNNGNNNDNSVNNISNSPTNSQNLSVQNDADKCNSVSHSHSINVSDIRTNSNFGDSVCKKLNDQEDTTSSTFLVEVASPKFNSLNDVVVQFLKSLLHRKQIAEQLYEAKFTTLALLTIALDDDDLEDFNESNTTDLFICKISRTAIDSAKYFFRKFPEIINDVLKLISIYQERILRNINKALASSVVTELNFKRKRVDTTEPGGSSVKSKKTKEHNLISEIFVNLGIRAVNGLAACPIKLPVNLGVCIMFNNNVHIAITELISFKNLFDLSLRFVKFSPELELVQPNKELTFTSITKYIEYLRSINLQIEGKSRTTLYSSFDSRLKNLQLLLFPKDLDKLQKLDDDLVFEDFLKHNQFSLKSRLSLLDIVLLLAYNYSDSASQIPYNILFTSSNTNISSETILLPKDIVKTVNYALSEGKTITNEKLGKTLQQQLRLLESYHRFIVNK